MLQDQYYWHPSWMPWRDSTRMLIIDCPGVHWIGQSLGTLEHLCLNANPGALASIWDASTRMWALTSVPVLWHPFGMPRHECGHSHPYRCFGIHLGCLDTNPCCSGIHLGCLDMSVGTRIRTGALASIWDASTFEL